MIDLAERAAIQDLNIRYAHVCDSFMLEETVQCWSPDGVFDETESGWGRIEGHDALRAFFRDTIFANAVIMIHIMFNHLIETIDGDKATGACFTLCEVVKKDGVRSRIHAKYEDEYVKIDGQWKFKSRVIRASFARETVTG